MVGDVGWFERGESGQLWVRDVRGGLLVVVDGGECAIDVVIDFGSVDDDIHVLAAGVRPSHAFPLLATRRS